MGNTAETLPLRDIHLPDPVSWWPLAPGWWIVLLLLVLVLTGSFLLLRYLRKRKHSPLREARLALTQLRDDYAHHQDVQHLIRQLSALLRRTAVSVHHRKEVASLTGQAWLRFLDESMEGHPFSDGAGRVLASAPYQPETNTHPDTDKLLQLCEQWLEHQKADKTS